MSSSEINAEVRATLDQLDGSDEAAVSLLTGLSTDEFDNLGGMPK